MWSVKTVPKRGAARRASRSASGAGAEERWIVKLAAALLVVVLISLASRTKSVRTLPVARPWRDGSAGDARRELRPYLGRAAYSARALGDVSRDGGVDLRRRLGLAEVLEQERNGEDRRGGVRLALARDVGSRAVHRLEHRRRGAVRVDVARGRESDTARDRGGEIGEDVPEEVVGDDDVEARRVGHEEDRRGVDVQVVDRDVGELGIDRIDRATPEVPSVHQHVVLVHERELLARARRSLGESEAHDTLDAERRVDAHLVGNLVGRADADRTAVADVRALGTFTHDDDGEIARLGERAFDAREELRGAKVDVVVELEAQAEQEPALEHSAWDVRVADGAEQDRVVLTDRSEIAIGERLTRLVPAGGAEVEVGRCDREIGAAQGRLEHSETLSDHFGPDAVTGDDGETHVLNHADDRTCRPTWRTQSLSGWNKRPGSFASSLVETHERPGREGRGVR